MRPAFTLVELLTVTAIIAIVMAMVLSVPSQDKRRTSVEAAARELAATLRQARSLALERRSAYAVAFNIANGPGTSGRILNNWGGGHWYQILGPSDTPNVRSAMGWSHPLPKLENNSGYYLDSWLSGIKESWYGEPHVLAPRKVRFLALSDQDNGLVRSFSTTSEPNMRTFPASYPRPWCGWWESTTGMLHGWGGYDERRSGAVPITRSADGRNCSAFFFEGSTGLVTGSTNAADRVSTIDGRVLQKSGQVRPVVNGNWMDSYISFRPDGSASFGAFGMLRIWSYTCKGAASNFAGGNATGRGDIGDYGAFFDGALGGNYITDDNQQASHFNIRTGFFYLTLAPDAEADSNVFASAQAAQRSMMPAYRVGVSAAGDVRVIPVRSSMSAGRTLDTWILPADWTNNAITRVRYARSIMTNVDGSYRGQPVVDSITPEMLTQRAWWFAP